MTAGPAGGGTDLYSAAPGLCVGITGAPVARAHFAAEYGAARTHTGTPDVVADLHFTGALPPGLPRDGHKTVRWAVDLDPPGPHPLRVRLALAGRPRRFALSMVQGYVVEPLASVAAARNGLVLLPAAALTEDDGAVVVLGRSRSGKTSVVVRAVAAGRRALGDDQVLVDAAGQVRSWPRRLRVYSDLPQTAPAAVAGLAARHRGALRLQRLVKSATLGRVAPSLPLSFAALGGRAEPGPLPVRRLVVVERGGAGDDVVVGPLDVADAAALARTVLAEQRTRLLGVAGPAWSGAVEEVATQEALVLERALAGVPGELRSVPAAWGAGRAVDDLARALGVQAD